MNSLFQSASAQWARYSEYEYRQGEDGTLYIVPAPRANSAVYNPLNDSESLVIDALNIGLLCMGGNAGKRAMQTKIRDEIRDFAEKYGLLGFMTALPATPEFMNFDVVYLPRNRFIRAESMSAKDYAAMFFPFDDEVNENPNPKKYHIGDDGSIRVSLAARDKPKAIEMSYQNGYAERYDWLCTQFKDWAFIFCASFLYYEETDPLMADMHRKAISVFDGNVPTYHIELFDKPTLVWDFHSLLLMAQMILSLMLTDESRPLRSCKHCNRAFIANHTNAAFCGPKCKNQYNVYKSRRRRGKE
jgi:hypothetical protein